VVLLLAFTFFTVGIPVLIAVIQRGTEKAYRFPVVSIDATVRPDGDLILQERRTVEFRNGPFTYAYFDVNEPQAFVREFRVTELTPSGEVPRESFPSQIGGHFEATWFYPDANDERRTFVFRYRVACAVQVYADTAHLYWQFIGTGWAAPTDHAVVTLHLPGRAPEGTATLPASCDPEHEPMRSASDATPLGAGDVRAWGHGPLNGEVHVVDPQTVRFEVHDVPAHRFVEGSILFPRASVPSASASAEHAFDRIRTYEADLASQANAARREHRDERRLLWILLSVMPGAYVFLVLLAKLRDRVPGVPRVVQEPPEEDPVETALLWSAWRGHLNPMAAYRTQLLHLASSGAIRIEAVGRVTDPEDIVARRGDVPGDERDRRFVEMLFADRGETISLKKPARVKHPKGLSPAAQYKAWWDNAQARAGDVLVRVRKGDSRLESVTAFLVAGLAAVMALTASGQGWLRLAVLAVGVLGMVVALRLIPARLDPPTRERVAKLAAFRRFLRRFSDLPNAPALAIVIWERYLEFATALGVAREVEKQVKALVPVESLPSPFPGAPSDGAGLSLWDTVDARAIVVMLSSTTTASSSSSSGFGSFSSSSGFGGGFSGGGGGGGGGTGGGFG
jgi:uncharacterized membrane protein